MQRKFTEGSIFHPSAYKSFVLLAVQLINTTAECKNRKRLPKRKYLVKYLSIARSMFIVVLQEPLECTILFELKERRMYKL